MKTNIHRNGSLKTSLQRAAGLLLLALLAANPLSGFAQGVIDTDTTGGVNLNDTFSVPTNSVTVAPDVTIDNSENDSVNAIDGSTRSWHLTNNAATINGVYNDGVHFTAGGSVDNLTDGVIAADQRGIYISGSVGTVNNNSGATIIGTNGYGVYLANGGSVNNSGTINAYGDDAVGISGGTGSVVNSGTIYGSNSDGVDLYRGGTVNNLEGGMIEGGNGNGVYISGGVGVVTNAGTIQSDNSDYSAVYMSQGGSVNNLSGGTITGGYSGVYIEGGRGSVINAGTITGNNSAGVEMYAGGTVDNSGTIEGRNGSGVYIEGGVGNVVNSGTINGSSVADPDGVHFATGGSVTNLSGGGIYGQDNGVYITGGLGTVVNAGTIIGTNSDGVSLNYGGSVSNSGAGNISYAANNAPKIQFPSVGGIIGNQNGVYITGGLGSVDNTGTIIGNNNDGVRLNNGGSVNNVGSSYLFDNIAPRSDFPPFPPSPSSGFIEGYYNGVYITGGRGSVDNTGTIIGDYGDGVYLNQGGVVNNSGFDNFFPGIAPTAAASPNISFPFGGLIQGAVYGVEIAGGTGYVTNSGTIRGNGRSGVRLRFGGIVANDFGGTIYGNHDGVHISGGIGSVYNSGTITGNGDNGVQLDNGGSVSQSSEASIAGYNCGIAISGGTGDVVNDGTIIGTNSYGVYLGGGGSVNNQTNGVIQTLNESTDAAVYIEGGSGSVLNAGQILGTGNNGVLLENGGGVNNLASGYIVGMTDNGIAINGSTGYVTNAGTISGGVDEGIEFESGGVVNNLSGGTIGGNHRGVLIEGGEGFVYNAGTITGTNYEGVLLSAGGSVNQSGGNASITGYTDGVRVDGGAGSVYNYDGRIVGNNGDGVRLTAGGSVDNDIGFVTGSIEGSVYGVEISGGAGYVTNSGDIYGDGRSGVRLRAGGTIVNEESGYIYGNHDGVHISGDTGIVNNSGEIYGDGDNGIQLDNGGSVNNSGYIYGSNDGIHVTGGAATIVNSGRIRSGEGNSITLDNYNNTVTLQTGSRLDGDVYGGSATDALILQGTGGEDNNFYNFETLTVQADTWDGHTNGWNLTGNNTFTNRTTVETGLLRINGTLSTPLLEVTTNGGLGGSGIIIGTVDNHGFSAPGNSPGSVTVIGSLTNYSTYFAQVDNTPNSDHIFVSDTATIVSGGVVVQPTKQIYALQTIYTLLTATNGVFGTNDFVSIIPQFQTNAPLFLTASLQYDPNNVYLTLDRSPFVSVAKTFNQTAVAKTLDAVADAASLGTAPGVSNLVTEMFWLPTSASALKALDSLSGEIHGTVGLVEGQQQQLFSSLIERRMQGVRAGTAGGEMTSDTDTNKNWGVWLQGFGMFGTLSSDGNAAGGDFNISGLSGGVEYKLNPSLTVGVSAGYAASDVTIGDRQSSGNVDSFQFAGYGNYTSGPWYLDGVFSYGHNDITTKRQISVGSIQELAKGSYNGDVLAVSAEGGYSIHCCEHWDLQPLVGFKYTTLMQDGFRETGATAGLAVNSVDMDSFRSTLGVRLAASFGKENGVQFMPQISARWEHEFMDLGADVNSQFLGGSPSMITRGVRLEAESGVLDAGFMVAFSKSVHAFVGYAATLNAHLTSQTVSGGVSYSW